MLAAAAIADGTLPPLKVLDQVLAGPHEPLRPCLKHLGSLLLDLSSRLRYIRAGSAAATAGTLAQRTAEAIALLSLQAGDGLHESCPRQEYSILCGYENIMSTFDRRLCKLSRVFALPFLHI